MTRLGIALLAASAAWMPHAAMAQTVPDPDAAAGLPNLALNLPASSAVASAAPAARAGTSWSEGAAAGYGGPPPQMGHGGMGGHPPMTGHPPMMGGHPPMMGRPPMGGHPPKMGRPPMTGYPPMMGHPPKMGYPPRMGHPPMMGGGHRNMHWQRIDRGGHVPRSWWSNRFRIRNWNHYGFPQPWGGGSWIRYYDDALLIDRDGRVLDGRYGWDWGRYGGGWNYGDDGVPYADDGYADNGGYGDDDDYDDEGGYDDGDRGPPPPPSCASRCAPARGYGYGYGAPVIVRTTVVTEAPVVETRTVYRTVVEHVRVAPRPRAKARCYCRVSAPPRAGERG
jgi:Ni/Co efflux regulator RcnB